MLRHLAIMATAILALAVFSNMAKFMGLENEPLIWFGVVSVPTIGVLAITTHLLKYRPPPERGP